MSLEPQVIRRIKHEKSKGRRQRILTRVPLLLGITACVVLISLKLAVWSQPGEALAAPSRVFLWIALSLFAVSVAGFIAWFAKLRVDAGRITEEMTVPAEDRGGLNVKTFRDALDAVAIGAGVPAPRLVVARLPTTNALPVYREGAPHAAVSEEALQAGLSYRDAEAMMAQVLSRIMLGHAWGTPVIFRSGLVPFFLLGVFAFLIVITMLVFLPGEADYLAAAALAVIALFWAMGPLGRYLFRHGDIARAHADALADSIAVKLTGDPSGMKALIERLAAGMGDVEFTLPLQYVSRYLFVCPTGAATPDGEPGGGDVESAREEAFRGVLAKTLAYANRAMELRIENLEAIEGGRWPAFED